MKLLILATLATLAAARPSFIAVPADQIAFVDLSNIHLRRVPRQTLTPPPPPLVQLPQGIPIYDQEYQPIQIQQYQQQPLALGPVPPQQNQRVVTLQQVPADTAGSQTLRAPARLSERPPDFGEYVDFGAHTGDSGAFGWYADYPVNNHGDSSSYRK